MVPAPGRWRAVRPGSYSRWPRRLPNAPWLGRSEKLRVLAAAGAAGAARRVCAPARALALRAALVVHTAAGQETDAILAAPLVAPLADASQKLLNVEDSVLFATDALDTQTLNLARGGAQLWRRCAPAPLKMGCDHHFD